MLSFSISSREVPITRHAIVDIIEPFPDLCKAIIDKYCDILSYMTKRAEHQKPLLDQRRKTSTEIYTLFYNDPMFNPDLDDEDNDEIDEKDKHEFAPETYDLLTETMINSSESLLGEKLPEPYQIHQRKLKQISDNFRGFQ